MLLSSTSGAVTPGTGVFQTSYRSFDVANTNGLTTTGVAVAPGLGTSSGSFGVAVVNRGASDQFFHLNPVSKNTMLGGGGLGVYQLNAAQTNTMAVRAADVTGDGVTDIIIALENSADVVAGYVYQGSSGNPAITQMTRINVGSSAIPSVALSIAGTDIEILDANGGVHYFARVGTNTWPTSVYADPNAPVGSTTAATQAHDHQDTAGTLATADLDGDSFSDIVSGNQISLSSQTATKGDFSAVDPINYNYGPAPLATVPFDSGDGDTDLFVIPGPSSQQSTPPFVLLNRGDGVNYEKVEITSFTTPVVGPWRGVSVRTTTAYGDKVVVGFGDTSNTAVIITPPTSSGGTDSVATITALAGKATLQVDAVDVDGDGVKELIHLAQGNQLDILSTTDGGATWAIARSLNAPSGSTSFAVGDIDGDQVNDVVVGGDQTYRVFFGPDRPVAYGATQLNLINWGSVSRDGNPINAGYTIEHVAVFDADSNGFDDVLIVSKDATGANTKRDLYYTTNTMASSRNIGVAPTNVQLSDENGLEILTILAVDANADGATDLVYGYQDGRSKVVLSTIAARTDLSELADAANGIVSTLAERMNPSHTPSELTCRENPSDASCYTSNDGAWYATEGNRGRPELSSMTQWGRGHITDTPRNITIGAAVGPNDPSVDQHAPPCALPGENVVGVSTTFYLEFPLLDCVGPTPECVIVDPLESVSHTFPTGGEGSTEACSYRVQTIERQTVTLPSPPPSPPPPSPPPSPPPPAREGLSLRTHPAPQKAGKVS